MYLKMAKQKVPAILLAFFFLFTLMPPLSPAYAADGYLDWEDDTFIESDDNDGSIDNYIKVYIVPDDEDDIEFNQTTDMVDDGWAEVDNVPDGLTCRIRSDNGEYVKIYLDGEADDNESDDSIDDLEIEFLDDAFSTGDASDVDDSSRDDIAVEFEDNDDEYDGSLDWGSAEFNESDDNDGSIEEELTVTLDIDADDFDGFEESDDMIDDGMAEVTYLPAGLTCIIATEDDNTVTITLEGEADYNDEEDSVDYLKIEFLDSAFTNDDAERVENSTNSSLEINFIANEPTTTTPVVTTPVVTQSITASFVLNSPTYLLNGVPNTMDVSPFAENDRTFVPVRYLAYCLGMTEDNVVYDATARTATLNNGLTTVILQIGSNIMLVNGTGVTMDVSPKADSDRIFLPARFVVEAFGGGVNWNAATNTVTIVKR